MTKPHKIRPLTDRQRSVWEFIAESLTENGFPPTLREIGTRFNIGTTNGVRTMLDALEKKGYLKRTPYLSRGIEVLKWPDHLDYSRELNLEVTRIPIVGKVAAGTPLLAEQNIEGELVLDRSLFPTGDGFALRVTGESMIEAGINDGDFVLTRPDLPIENGMIVVALLGEEATVKYYHQDSHSITLNPANPHYQPISVSLEDDQFRIVGRVVGLFRRY